MTLIDTSAWIEFLRDTGSPACGAVDELLRTGFATTPAIRMELLARARDGAHLDRLRRMLSRGDLIGVSDTDFEDAAAIYRSCRVGGETVRRMLDCLIASVAVRADVPLLHSDRDFDTLARHTRLRTVTLN